MLIKKYSENWVLDFSAIKAALDQALHGLAYTIEHVGSTAVPNLDSKAIIDIDIIYTSRADFEKISWSLEQAGYYHNGNQGIEDREVFKRKENGTHEILDSITHHLYVCPVTSAALERHLLSRNFLRKHDEARLQYQQLKYELAEKARQDKKAYAALKEIHINAFIDWMMEEEKRTDSKGIANNGA